MTSVCERANGVVSAGPEPAGGEPSVVLVPGTDMNAAVCMGMAELPVARWHTVVKARPHRGVAACRMRTIVTAEFADDSADTAVPAAAPQAARPTEVNTDGQLRIAGAGPSSAATRRGTGPGAAKPPSVGTGVPRETRAALPIAHATALRLPTACAASSSAHRSAMYATAVRRGRRNGLARAASWTASRNR